MCIPRNQEATWSYQFLHAKQNMRREELETLHGRSSKSTCRTTSRADSDISTWYTEFDRTVEMAVSNGPNEFGDVLTSLEVNAPGAALQAWLKPRTDAELKTAKMDHVPGDPARPEKAASVLLLPGHRETSSALPAPHRCWYGRQSHPRPRSPVSDGKLKFNTETDVYWNFPDDTLRSVMARKQCNGRQSGPGLIAGPYPASRSAQERAARLLCSSEAPDFRFSRGRTQFELVCV